VGALTFTENGAVGAVTLTDVVADAESPPLSFTAPVTVNVPALLYVCVAVGPATTVPSPKSMVELAMVPSASFEFAVEAVTVIGAVPVAGVTEITAVGAWFPATVTVAFALEVALPLSVTVAVTV
jgi:hypothetical protein